MAENKDWVSRELWNNKNDKEIDKLFNLYEKNRRNARVVFMSGDYNRFQYQKLYLFEDPDSDDFDIVLFRVRHGISVTNKMYTHKKREMTFRYREKNGFWVTRGKGIRRPTTLSVFNFYEIDKFVKFYMANKFTWYRCMVENNLDFSKDLTIHTVWSKKLFNLNKLLKAFYNVPIQTAKMLHKHRLLGVTNGESASVQSLINLFRKNNRFIKNIENLQDWHFDEEYEYLLRDSIDMARKLGEVVNLSWSKKRLKQEHDDWAEELTQILFIDDNKALNIRGVYKLFAAFSKYYLIKTTRGLAMEGQKQKHCVGGYGNSIDNGTCAIFHVNGYTLDLRIRLRTIEEEEENEGRLVTNYNRLHELYINQFRGFSNKNAPEKLRKEVQAKIDEFNEEFKDHDALTKSHYNYNAGDKDGNYNITAGAEDYEIFDLDNLDEDGEPTRILVDERVERNWIIDENPELAALFEDNRLDGDNFLPF
jgi:hypothetical protein